MISGVGVDSACRPVDSGRPAGILREAFRRALNVNLQEDYIYGGRRAPRERRAAMSIRVMSEAWDKSEASGTTLLILIALGDHADSQGVCFPYVTSLAAKARCDEKTVRRAIRTLQDAKELDIWEWYDKRTGRKRNCYRIVVGDFAVFRGVEPDEIRERATLLRVNVPTAVRRAVFERDHWTCVQCESKTELTIDHVIPVDEGGGNEDENLQTLCAICNRKKANSIAGKSRPGEMSARQVAEMSTPDRTPVSASHAGAVPSPEPSEGTTSTPRAELVLVVPKLTKIDGRDVAFDTLAEQCGIRPGSPRLREVAIALNGRKGHSEEGIREQRWHELYAHGYRALAPEATEAYERALADEIEVRANIYRRKMPGAALTPTALAKWWTDLPGLPDPGRGDGRVRPRELFEEAARLQKEGR